MVFGYGYGYETQLFDGYWVRAWVWVRDPNPNPKPSFFGCNCMVANNDSFFNQILFFEQIKNFVFSNYVEYNQSSYQLS